MASKKTGKYDQILDGALKVFAKSGFHRSQVSKIAKEAGVADGTIYLYFKNKEDILIHLLQVKLDILINKFHDSIQHSTDVKDSIRKICEIHFTELENNVDLAYVTQIELRQNSLELRKEIGRAVKPYFNLIEQLVNQGMEEKLFRPNIDAKLIRLLIFGAMDEAVTSWLISGRKYSLSREVDGTVEFILRGIEV